MMGHKAQQDGAMKLYVEATHTEQSDMNTGIPRVVRNILRSLLELEAEERITVYPTIFRDNIFVVVPAERVLKGKGRKATRHRWLAPILGSSYRRLRRFIGYPIHASLEDLLGADPGGRHVLLLLDASWAYSIWSQVEALKARGMRVVSIVYDLIPITHPHTVVESLVTAFEYWLARQMRYADRVVCISKSMADVVGEYFQKRLQSTEMTRSIPVSSFYLGCDLDFVDDLNAVQEKILSLEKVKSPIFLMVGTIEPRKKHRDVLGAFERLWAQGVEARLVIVGGRDWMSGELLAEIAGHAEAERRLFLIRDASDSDLQWLYERAAALIMASEVEGFGLPIVEAKRAGLPVICSNIPVFAEIAAGEAEFFRLGNVDDLVRAILKRLASCGECATTSRGWISWRESARQLLDAVRAVPL